MATASLNPRTGALVAAGYHRLLRIPRSANQHLGTRHVPFLDHRSNTTMETEIPAMLRARENIRPERFTCHSSRMRMQKVTKEELESMNREGVRCAAELAD